MVVADERIEVRELPNRPVVEPWLQTLLSGGSHDAAEIEVAADQVATAISLEPARETTVAYQAGQRRDHDRLGAGIDRLELDLGLSSRPHHERAVATASGDVERAAGHTWIDPQAALAIGQNGELSERQEGLLRG